MLRAIESAPANPVEAAVDALYHTETDGTAQAQAQVVLAALGYVPAGSAEETSHE